MLLTVLISGIFYWSSLSSLEVRVELDRAKWIETNKKELKAHLRMGRTAIKALYDADQNGENKEAAKAILKAMRFADDGYFFAYDSKGVNTLHAVKPSLEGKNLYGLKDGNGVPVIAGLIDAAKGGDGFLYFSWHKPSINGPAPKLGYAEYLPKWDWVLGTGIYIDDIDQQVVQDKAEIEEQIHNQLYFVLLVSCVVLIVTSVIIGLVVSRALVPLHNMVNRLNDISEGDGDLTGRLAVVGNDELAELGTTFNGFMDKLQPMIREIQETSVIVQEAAKELDDQTAFSNQTMQSHSQETEKVVTAVTQMSATSREVANNTNATAESIVSANQQLSDAHKEVTQAIEGINQLVTEVNTTSDAIESLSDQTDRITSVIEVIGGIADQTNLLALNAAIEAARAGEQGRGFAVVADEVRSLASRTQQSTEEINQMLTALQDGVRTAVTTMSASKERGEQTVQDSAVIQDRLEGIQQAVGTIHDMGLQTASAAEEQSAVAEDINQNLMTIQQMVHELSENLQLAQEISSSLTESGGHVHELVGNFRA